MCTHTCMHTHTHTHSYTHAHTMICTKGLYKAENHHFHRFKEFSLSTKSVGVVFAATNSMSSDSDLYKYRSLMAMKSMGNGEADQNCNWKCLRQSQWGRKKEEEDIVSVQIICKYDECKTEVWSAFTLTPQKCSVCKHAHLLMRKGLRGSDMNTQR